MRGNEGVGWRLKKFGGVYVWDFKFLEGGIRQPTIGV